MIFSNNIHKLLLLFLFVIAGFMSAVISNVKIPVLVILFLVFVYMLNYKFKSRYYITMVIFLLMSNFVSFFNSFDTIFYSSYLIIFVLIFYIGLSAFNLNLVLHDKWFAYVIKSTTVIFFSFVLTSYLAGINTNTLLPTGSRNSLGAIILSMGSISYLLSSKYRNIFLLATCFLLFALGGRTNQFSALLMAVFMCMTIINSKFFNILICLLAVGSIAAIELTLGFGNFTELVFINESGTSIGLRSTRSIVWDQWIDNITFSKFIFGFSLAELPFVYDKLNGNPHNSFILIHSYVGILFIFFISWLIYKSLIIDWSASFFIGLLLFKGFFDTILFPSSLDIFILFFLFIGHHAKVRNI